MDTTPTNDGARPVRLRDCKKGEYIRLKSNQKTKIMKKTFNPQNPWMKLGNAIVLPLILITVPFIAALVIFETITNKQDENY